MELKNSALADLIQNLSLLKNFHTLESITFNQVMRTKLEYKLVCLLLCFISKHFVLGTDSTSTPGRDLKPIGLGFAPPCPQFESPKGHSMGAVEI